MDLSKTLLVSLALSGLYFLKETVFIKPIAIWFLSYRCFDEKTAYGKHLGIGLLLSSLGDILLEVDDEFGVDLFIPGLVSFLLAHILYIYALKEPLQSGFWLILAAVLVYVYIVLSTLLPKVGSDLRIPVGVYGCVIGAMAFFAVNRCLSSKYNLTSRVCAAIGAISFVSSDTLLAFDKFSSPINNAKHLVMLTYYAGQILIALSCISPLSTKKST